MFCSRACASSLFIWQLSAMHIIKFKADFSPNLIFCYDEDTLNIFICFSGLAAPSVTTDPLFYRWWTGFRISNKTTCHFLTSWTPVVVTRPNLGCSRVLGFLKGIYLEPFPDRERLSRGFWPKMFVCFSLENKNKEINYLFFFLNKYDLVNWLDPSPCRVALSYTDNHR